METDTADLQLDLLYPFYLDTDMSMAFAAALAGGVALEEEHVDRSDQSSQAIKNLRGNIRAFKALGLEGGRETQVGEGAEVESKLVRRHNMASIFIGLYDELRLTNRLITEPRAESLRVGEIVSFQAGPAVAPLRRVVDQIIRLLDVAEPLMALGEDEEEQAKQQPGIGQLTRQQRRALQRAAQKTGGADDPEAAASSESELAGIKQLFVALREDLDRSGMIDIAIERGDEPPVLLSLDKRFLTDSALELLHTSAFTVVGKVTQVWNGPDDVVNLYRRSVLSLLPSLSQVMAFGVLGLLSGLASNLPVQDIQRMAMEAASGGSEPPDTDEDEDDEVLLGPDVTDALNPTIKGPAFQILPLAICA